MTDTLDDFVAAAAAAWPEIEVPHDAFRAHVVELLGREDQDVLLPSLAGVDLYLAFACLEGHARAWRTLEREHLAKIDEYVRKVDASPAFADEVRQRISEKLAGGRPDSKLLAYSGRGPLWAWIRIAALREAQSLVRRKKTTVSDEQLALQATDDDPELQLLRHASSEAFRRAFAEVLRELDGESRSLLKLHYLDGLTLEESGRALRLSRATAARRIAEARSRIVSGVERVLQSQLGKNAPRAGSLLELVDSRFNLSLQGFFVDGSPSS